MGFRLCCFFKNCCCNCPQEPGLTPTFGSIYGSDSSRIAVLNQPIEFDFAGPVLNTAVDPGLTNSIVILETGIYEISVSLRNFNPNQNELGRYDIRRNGVTIPGSRFDSSALGSVTISKTIQAPLNAGDIITVVPSQVIGTPQYSSSALTVNLIG